MRHRQVEPPAHGRSQALPSDNAVAWLASRLLEDSPVPPGDAQGQGLFGVEAGAGAMAGAMAGLWLGLGL